MSRTIKFRAWDKSAKQWVGKKQDMLLVGHEGVVTIEYRPHPRGTWEPGSPKQLTWPEVRNLEVMQYTGIKDKNGREIYEGDILKSAGVVAWNDIQLRWSCIDIEWNDKREWHDMLYLATPLEVIGNIYEHKHLIKEEV